MNCRRVSLFLLLPLSSICAVLTNSAPSGKDAESMLYRALLGEAYEGDWHTLNNKSLPYDGFRQRNGKQWVNGSSEPFTGWYAQYDANDTARLLCSFYLGIREGPIIQWDALGKISLRGAYQSGKKHGVFTSWNHAGMKLYEKEYSNDKLDGWSFFWYETGQIRLRLLFEKGKLVEATGWLPDGQVCPHTRVEEGSGVIIHHESGAGMPKGLSSEIKAKTLKAN